MDALKVGSEFLRGLMDFVFPPLCLGCGEYTENEYAVCDTCLQAIEVFSHPFCLNCMGVVAQGKSCVACGEEGMLLYAFGNYSMPLEQIIVQYKFKGITGSAGMFAGLIADKFGDQIKRHDCRSLVPVPLYPGRENYRGYNQAAVFARYLSERLGIGIREDVIVRVKRRKPQARLNHAQRAVNIKGVFEVAKDLETPGKVILVDDVVTSGATIREAARVLRRAGVDVGAVISIAHAT